MNILGKFVTLRAIEETDLQLMKDMLNDPEIENLVIGWSLPISDHQQKKWYESNFGSMADLRFIIEAPENGAVGLATLTKIDWKNRTATHGIKMAKKEVRAKGIGTDAVMAVMRYAFDELQLHRLDGSLFDDNIASKALYLKCGWSIEGKRRECVYKRGKYRDVMDVGILAEDYDRLVEGNHYWDK